jgi:hypothetical protein
MKVELPGESKSFADIEAGECFAFTRKHVSSVCMKVEWLSSASGVGKDRPGRFMKDMFGTCTAAD